LSSGDTISQVVEVKGSTSIGFLVPYLCSTPWSYEYSDFPNLFIAAMIDPIGAALPTDSVISVNVFRAAGPDFQVSFPSAIGPALETKKKKKEKAEPKKPQKAQMNLNSEFSRAFPPIVKGVRIGMEFKSCQSESTQSIADLLKLNSAKYIPDWDSVRSFPYQNTNHFFLEWFKHTFHYFRGSYRLSWTTPGLFYRTSPEGEPLIGNIHPIIYQSPSSIEPPAHYQELALPACPLRSRAESAGLTVTMPWHAQVPYLPFSVNGVFESVSTRPTLNVTLGTEAVGMFRLAPGDDFVLGHQISPGTQ
jgi:hypothetical protein